MEENKLLGGYRLIKQIGQGSLGTTYVAEHRFTKKKYVLKAFPEEIISSIEDLAQAIFGVPAARKGYTHLFCERSAPSCVRCSCSPCCDIPSNLLELLFIVSINKFICIKF
jgi:serine/threonine protein kinase